MLALVVMVFILCWSPLLIFNVLQSFDIIPIGKKRKSEIYNKKQKTIEYELKGSAMLNMYCNTASAAVY